MNPDALTPQVDEFMDMNQNVNNVQSQLFQREMLFQDENYNLRLDSQELSLESYCSSLNENSPMTPMEIKLSI